MPPVNVEVAFDVLVMLPPEIASPFEVESPPPATWIPDAVKVEVADPVFRMEPATVSPPVDWRCVLEMPPAKVEVPVPDEFTMPAVPVKVSPWSDASPPPPETAMPPENVDVPALPTIVVVAVLPTLTVDVAWIAPARSAIAWSVLDATSESSGTSFWFTTWNRFAV